MAHKEILAKMNKHFDDLAIRDPRKYDQEERHLTQDEHRLGFEVAGSPPGVRAMEGRR